VPSNPIIIVPYNAILEGLNFTGGNSDNAVVSSYAESIMGSDMILRGIEVGRVLSVECDNILRELRIEISWRFEVASIYRREHQ
jgi:hypothetical protein